MEKRSFPWIYGTWVNKLNMAHNNTRSSKETNNACTKLTIAERVMKLEGLELRKVSISDNLRT